MYNGLPSTPVPDDPSTLDTEVLGFKVDFILFSLQIPQDNDDSSNKRRRLNNNEEIMNKLMKQKNVAVVSTVEAKKKRGAASAMTINHKEKEANKLDIQI